MNTEHNNDWGERLRLGGLILLAAGSGLQWGFHGMGAGVAGLGLCLAGALVGGLYRRFRPLPALFWLFLLAGAVSAVVSGGRLCSWVEVGQWSILLFGAWFVTCICTGEILRHRGLQLGIRFAFAVNVCIALWQSLHPASAGALTAFLYGLPYAAGGKGPDLAEEVCCGLMRSQLQYSAFVLLAAAVFESTSFPLCRRRWEIPGRLAVGFAVGATAHPVYVPAIFLLFLAARLRISLPHREGMVCRRFAMGALAAVLGTGTGMFCARMLPYSSSPWDYIQPFSLGDGSAGEIKRSVVEWGGAIHSIDRHPLGYGPGTYVESVRRACAEAGLRKPVQNRVRRDGNGQFQILLVETGWPGTLLFLLGILGALLAACRPDTRTPGDEDSGMPVFLPAAAIAVSAAFTGIFTTGLGPLSCFLLLYPLALSSSSRDSGFRPGAIGLQLALLPGVLSLGLLVREAAPDIDEGENDSATVTAAETVLLIEAEDAVRIVGAFEIRPAHDCGANRMLSLPAGSGKKGSRASYVVRVTAPGEFRLWIRVLWEGGCANSIQGQFAQGPPLTFEDAIFGRWHWVDATPSRPVFLAAGEHSFELTSIEDGVHLDQIALLSNTRRVPVGILSPMNSLPPVQIPEREPSLREALPDFDAGEMPREDSFDKYKDNP